MAEVETKAEQIAKRKKKRDRVAAANKITFNLETGVRKTIQKQAREAGMNVGPFIQKLVEAHVIGTATTGGPLAARLTAKRAVLDHAINLARKIDDDGGFDEHFILTVMRSAAQDPDFKAQYDAALGGSDGTPKRSARVALNQQLGRLIKRAAGARSKRDAAGKIMRGQAQGEVLSSYTLLDKATQADS